MRLTRWSLAALPALGVALLATPAKAQSMTCASNNNQYNYCAINTRGAVHMVHQISRDACIQGQTWGFDARGIWVDRGCRAEFQVGGGQSGSWHGSSGNYGERVECASNNNGYNHCNVNTGGHVRLVRQISSSACVAGQSWGFDNYGIWVDDGCRAEFEVQGGGGRYSNLQVLTNQSGHHVRCESQNGNYARCRVHVSGGVRVVNNISSTRCVEGQTWGHDSNGIWVNGGCRAEFAIGEGYGANNPSPYAQYNRPGRTITCESQNDQRRVCGVANAHSVTMARQLSSSACVEGVSWGRYSGGIWVDNGCRAEFRIQ